ncbi:MAG: hypothetical protein QXK76_01920 [Candidatus Woesearchaeota archaeon]
MNILIEKAFEGLGIQDNRIHKLSYSGHFKNYNANAKHNSKEITFKLSKEWKLVDDEIQIGLLQSLLVKIFKIKAKTAEIELYENFIKGLSKYAKKHTQENELRESFQRVNQKMFNGLMDEPNLLFASESFSKLGSYDYTTDTIYISKIFKNIPTEESHILDYVMYHEMLHKKHSFRIKNGKHHAHTTAFREDEKKFGENSEKLLNDWLKRKKIKKWSFW